MAEQRSWEEQKIASALHSTSFGAKNKKEAEPVKEYELLLEDQVEFIAQEILSGRVEAPMSQAEIDEKKKQEEELAKLGERERVERVRKSLPVYGYKDDLMDSIKENQVRSAHRVECTDRAIIRTSATHSPHGPAVVFVWARVPKNCTVTVFFFCPPFACSRGMSMCLGFWSLGNM